MYRPAVIVLLSLGLAACEDSTLPMAPRTGFGEPAYAISDGAHNSGNAHFFFLPPMLPAPTFSGVFDAGLAPVVEICALATPAACASGPLVASYSMTTGSGGELVTVDPLTEHYSVKWWTKDFNLSTSIIYRISVRVGAAQALGFADVQVVLNNQQAKNVDTRNSIPLVVDKLLLIQFRIERGAVGPPTIGIDATALSAPTISLDGVSNFPTAAVQSFPLEAGSYKLYYGAGVSQPSIVFSVTTAGTVDYAPALDGILDGRGTTTLRVNGRTIQVDATPLSVPLFEVNSIFGGATALPTSVVKTMTLLPADHQVLYNAGVSQPSVIFTLTTAGTVDYAPALDGILDGRGTTTLRVNGRTIQVDATALGVPTFDLFGAGTFPATSVQPLTLLPAEHEIRADTRDFSFVVMGDGTLAFDALLYPFLSGAGTDSLVVH
jgi:hypothetical protein